MPMNIAIDGPAGAGKSTAARMVAEKFGYIYVDTGAMYRAMALYMLREEIDPADQGAVEAACEKADISLEYKDGVQQVLLNGENVTAEIRTPEVSRASSAVSAYGAVRAKLVELQRKLAGRRDVVMDGRDIGTAVLPNADLKVYLTASAHVRALRRFKELPAGQAGVSLDEVEAEITARDKQDMEREISPLKRAEDAVLLDTSDMSLEEVVRELEELVEDAGSRGCCGC